MFHSKNEDNLFTLYFWISSIWGTFVYHWHSKYILYLCIRGKLISPLTAGYLVADYLRDTFSVLVLCLPVCLNVALCAGGEGPLKRSFDEHFTQLGPLVLRGPAARERLQPAWAFAGPNGGRGSRARPGRNDFDIPPANCRAARHSFVSGQRDLNSIKTRQGRGNNADKLASGPCLFLYVSCCQFPP